MSNKEKINLYLKDCSIDDIAEVVDNANCARSTTVKILQGKELQSCSKFLRKKYPYMKYSTLAEIIYEGSSAEFDFTYSVNVNSITIFKWITKYVVLKLSEKDSNFMVCRQNGYKIEELRYQSRKVLDAYINKNYKIAQNGN